MEIKPTQEARNILSHARRRSESAAKSLQRGQTDQAAIDLAVSIGGMAEAINKLADIIDRLDQEKTQ